MHRLVQEVIRDCMDTEERRRWAGRAVEALDALSTDIPSENWQQRERLVPHLTFVAGWIGEYNLETKPSDRLVNETADYLQERAQFAEAATAAAALLNSRFRSRGRQSVSSKPEYYVGRVVGKGDSVSLIKQVAQKPLHPMQWKAGAKVWGNKILPDTAIATFVQGRYPYQGGHAAIYIRQDAAGIWVWDQRVRESMSNGKRRIFPGIEPVRMRFIPFMSGFGRSKDDADRFYVIE